MKLLIFLALIVCLTLQTVVPHVGPVKSHAPKTYKVSLDDTPEQRWKQIIYDFQEPLKRFVDYFDLLPIPESFFHGV
jgi:hypothetical protein